MVKNRELSKAYNIDIDDHSVFNEVYLPYLEAIKRYEIYYGGSGSGKSTFIGQKLALQMSAMPGRNLVCLRSQEVDCRDSCYPEIYNSLEEFQLIDLWHIVEHPAVRMTHVISGNTILFTGVDDIENIKSIKFKNRINDRVARGNLTDVWYEEISEEETPDAIRELDRRLRDKYLQCRIIASFNPININHWLKGWIEELEAMDADRIILKTTYKHNIHLPQDYRQMLENYRYTSPYDYRVYALGEWGVMGGSVFNSDLVDNRITELKLDAKRLKWKADFTFDQEEQEVPQRDKLQVFETDDGETTIYEKPKPRTPYVMAFDTAGEGSDFWAAHVLNNITKEQAAVFRSPQGPVPCTRQLFALAHYYNTALVAPEINFDSYPLEKFKEWKYPKIYQREKPTDEYSDGMEQKLGFRTTTANRQRILSNLVGFVNNNITKIKDVDTLNECLTFVRTSKKNKGIFWGAASGAHDDLVISLAICYEATEQQLCEEIASTEALTGFWFPEQIDHFVKSGKIDFTTAKEYKKKNPEIFEMFKKEVKKVSRYG